MVFDEKTALEGESPELREKVLEVRNAIYDHIRNDPGPSLEEWLHKIRDELLPQLRAPNPLLRGKKDSETITGMAFGNTPYVAFEGNEIELRRPSLCEYTKGTNYHKRKYQVYRNIVLNSEPVTSTDPADKGRMCEVATTNLNLHHWRFPVDQSPPALEDISQELAAMHFTGRALVYCTPREVENLPKEAGVKKEAVGEENTENATADDEQESE